MAATATIAQEQPTHPRQLSGSTIHGSALGQETLLAHTSRVALLPLLEANACFARRAQRIQVQEDTAAAVIVVNEHGRRRAKRRPSRGHRSSCGCRAWSSPKGILRRMKVLLLLLLLHL